MTTIFYATMDTEKFEFEGFGATRKDAMAALGEAWNVHAEQCNRHGANVPPFKQARREYEIREREIELGRGYRDQEPLGLDDGGPAPATPERSRSRPRRSAN